MSAPTTRATMAHEGTPRRASIGPFPSDEGASTTSGGRSETKAPGPLASVPPGGRGGGVDWSVE